MTEKLEELQLPREAMESESRGAIYSIPIMEDGAGGSSSSPEDPAEAPGILLGNLKPIPCILTPLEKLGAGGQVHWMLGSWAGLVLAFINSSTIKGISPVPLPNLVFK